MSIVVYHKLIINWFISSRILLIEILLYSNNRKKGNCSYFRRHQLSFGWVLETVTSVQLYQLCGWTRHRRRLLLSRRSASYREETRRMSSQLCSIHCGYDNDQC